MDTRSKILEAAERCFYRRGITATGVDALAAEAGVSKRTLYRHFGSKEGVVTTYLERREARWRRRLERGIDGEGPAVDRLIDYLHLYMYSEDPATNRGCAFINASAELAADSHPGRAIIEGSIDRVAEDIAAILEDARVPDARELAEEILLVYEGAMSVTGIRRDDGAGKTAERLIRRLLS